MKSYLPGESDDSSRETLSGGQTRRKVQLYRYRYKVSIRNSRRTAHFDRRTPEAGFVAFLADQYVVGQSPPSFDKQFVRDYLETLDWNKNSPGPLLPPDVIEEPPQDIARPFVA